VARGFNLTLFCGRGRGSRSFYNIAKLISSVLLLSSISRFKLFTVTSSSQCHMSVLFMFVRINWISGQITFLFNISSSTFSSSHTTSYPSNVNCIPDLKRISGNRVEFQVACITLA
jgi:hypothetical protein